MTYSIGDVVKKTGLSAYTLRYYEKEGLKRMDAIKAAAKDRGIPKSELYSRLLR